MTKPIKSRKLAHEILALILLSAAVSLILFLILTGLATVVAEEYVFYHDVVMTEFDWMELDRWIFGAGMAIAVICFSALFLMLLADRIAYIRAITDGIDRLGRGEQHDLPLKGSNELTALAGAVNQMSAAQRQLRQQEQALVEEKEQFIRTLSHDIRTPLTSILAYSSYLSGEECPPQQQQAYLEMIQKKAEQIRDLTGVLLDGSHRNVEQFADARLLIQQLAAEFEEALEEQFTVESDFSGCPAFGGSFDVQELRRIFDNLSSNVRKYADPAQPIRLEFRTEGGVLQIQQGNTIRGDVSKTDSYGLGLHSIRRIVQHYGGQVSVTEEKGQFRIHLAIPL